MEKVRIKLILMIIVLTVLFSCGTLSVSANMAEPNYSDTSSGIVFSQNQIIGVESEVLNIDLTQFTASVEAIYNLKNESESAVSLDAMFLAPIGGEHAYETFENDITVEFGGEQLDYTTSCFYSKDYAENYADLINNWEQVLASYDGTDYDESYDMGFIGAIEYKMDFEAGESKQLIVSYLSGTGGYTYQDISKIDFSYLLTPASYWSSFGGIEINVTVPVDINQITSSSLEFERISETQFQYVSESLPSDELTITLSNKSNLQTYVEEVVCFFGILICPIIFVILSIVFVVLRRRKKYSITAKFALILSILSLIFGTIWSFILQMYYGVVGAFFDEIFIIVVVSIFALVETQIRKKRNRTAL